MSDSNNIKKKKIGKPIASTSLNRKAGLSLNPSKIKSCIVTQLNLSNNDINHKINTDALVYITAIIEYLVFEILELSGNIVTKGKSIKREHIVKAIQNDTELIKIFNKLDYDNIEVNIITSDGKKMLKIVNDNLSLSTEGGSLLSNLVRAFLTQFTDTLNKNQKTFTLDDIKNGFDSFMESNGWKENIYKHCIQDGDKAVDKLNAFEKK